MSKENTKEFRVREYLHDFEKSLNYMAGALLAILVSGICLIASKSSWTSAELSVIFQEFHDSPTELLGVISAVLCTLPYYFYYTVKDDNHWNASRGNIDNFGLWKVFIWYELCVLSFYYLLFQGDVNYSLLKLTLSVVNVILACIYLFLLIKGRKDGEHIGYFISVIIMMIAFFILLAVNSFFKLINNSGNQNIKMLLLFILFAVNSGSNFFFLKKADTSMETGIISNRKKIMIPIISISIYTFSVVYCYFYFDNQWWIMLVAAIWITFYEIFISVIKYQSKIKKICCIGSFLIFVIGIPALVGQDENLPAELAIDWLTLIGVSIYLAAIKYWGYALKLLFEKQDAKGSKAKQMNIVVWFRNSILGSMLFLLVILLPSGRCGVLMITILICSFISEWFIYKYVLSKKITEDKDKVYFLGKKIEFAVIIFPIIAFVLEILFDLKLPKIWNVRLELPKCTEVWVALLGVVLILGYISRQWNGEEAASISVSNLRELFKILQDKIKKLLPIHMQTLPDRNTENFWTALVLWTAYFISATILLCIIPEACDYRIYGIFIMLLIIIVDWFLLTKKLIDYYMEKMKMGQYIAKFKDVFESKWKECLGELREFNADEADQFMVGDRVRPILFYLGSIYGRNENPDDEEYSNIAKAACSLELIHKSSVIFDDYIDGDRLRKGEQTFHCQYNDVNKLILVGNAMLAKAQTNFADCRGNFKCDDADMLDNMKSLSEIVMDLCQGCHKELSLPDYDMQNEEEIDNIIGLETVSLIKESIGLGYRCFHEKGNRDKTASIEQLGEAFGYVFQYLNDLEPFSQKEQYETHKGSIQNFDYGKKNLAMLTLYKKLEDDDKPAFEMHNYNVILQLYERYKIEDEILDKVRKKMDKMEQMLEKLGSGNQAWKKRFNTLFNYAVWHKKWEGKVPYLED